MKSIQLYVGSLLTVLTLFTACEQEEIPPVQEKDKDDFAIELNDDQEEAPSRLLAKIQKDGLEYTFMEIGDTEDNEYEVLLLTRVYDNRALENTEALLTLEASSPLENYTANTDDPVTVQAPIVKIAGQETLKAISRDTYSEETPITILEAGTENGAAHRSGCYDVTEPVFRDDYCNVPLVSSPNDIEFCDSGTWTSHVRNSTYNGSWRELNEVFTWTNVICGTTKLQFYRYKGSWQMRKEVILDRGIWRANYWTVTITEETPWLPFSPEIRSGSRLQVQRSQETNENYFRAYTRFKKNLYPG